MLREFIEFDIAVNTRQRLTMQEAEGGEVRCRDGALWITQQDGQDYVLIAGESMKLGSGMVVVEALQSSRLSLRQPDASLWSKLWRRLFPVQAAQPCVHC